MPPSQLPGRTVASPAAPEASVTAESHRGSVKFSPGQARFAGPGAAYRADRLRAMTHGRPGSPPGRRLGSRRGRARSSTASPSAATSSKPAPTPTASPAPVPNRTDPSQHSTPPADTPAGWCSFSRTETARRPSTGVGIHDKLMPTFTPRANPRAASQTVHGPSRSRVSHRAAARYRSETSDRCPEIYAPP